MMLPEDGCAGGGEGAKARRGGDIRIAPMRRTRPAEGSRSWRIGLAEGDGAASLGRREAGLQYLSTASVVGRVLQLRFCGISSGCRISTHRKEDRRRCPEVPRELHQLQARELPFCSLSVIRGALHGIDNRRGSPGVPFFVTTRSEPALLLIAGALAAGFERLADMVERSVLAEAYGLNARPESIIFALSIEAGNESGHRALKADREQGLRPAVIIRQRASISARSFMEFK